MERWIDNITGTRQESGGVEKLRFAELAWLAAGSAWLQVWQRLTQPGQPSSAPAAVKTHTHILILHLSMDEHTLRAHTSHVW